MKRIKLTLLSIATVAFIGSCGNPASAEGASATAPASSTPAETRTSEPVESLPTIYDFSAKWCGPCRVFGPIFDKVSKSPEYAGKINFVKVDVDQNPQMAQYFRISSIPAVVVVDSSNTVLGGRLGLMDETEFKALIKATLNL